MTPYVQWGDENQSLKIIISVTLIIKYSRVKASTNIKGVIEFTFPAKLDGRMDVIQSVMKRF